MEKRSTLQILLNTLVFWDLPPATFPTFLTEFQPIKKPLDLSCLLDLQGATEGTWQPPSGLKSYMPVLCWCLASLLYSEVNIIANHYKTTLESIQKLHQRTPAPVIFFLAGSLPGPAILHIRQLTLYSMICRLTEDPLNLHARYILSSAKKSTNSWFHQIRNLCLLYKLPHPLGLLDNPPKKE